MDLKDVKQKIDIKSMTLEELAGALEAMGEKPYRAKQIYGWLHEKLAVSFDEMTTLSKGLREALKERFSLTCLRMVEEKRSKIDSETHLSQ